MADSTQPITLATRAAPLTPSTFNADALTVEAVISTGAAVERLDRSGPYVEVLDLAPVDPDALAGLPLLDGHARWSASNVIGRVDACRREGDALVAVLRFSGADDVKDVVTKVQEGTLRAFSIGYAVASATETKGDDGRRVRTIVPAIREVSVVAIPADAAAQVRQSPETQESPVTVQTAATDVATPPAPAVVAERGAINAQIRSLAETAGLDRTWADAQIDGGAQIDAARAAAFEELERRRTANGGIRAHVGFSNDAPEVVAARAADALAARMTGGEMPEASRPYAALGLHDHARQSLARSGVNVGAMGRDEMLARAGAQGVSDFPLILDNAAHRVLRVGYGRAESPLKPITRPRSVSDMKPITALELGTATELHDITEHGEVKSVQLTESGESYRIATYAGMIALTRTALINDDLGAFADVSIKAGQLAAEKEAKLLARLLTAAPKMRDGKNLFHADHGNLAASGGALSVDTLSAARLAIRSQKGLDGETPVNATPRFLVVGAALETKAEQILATLSATKADDHNPFAGTLSLLVDARIDGNQWFVVADPATAPVFELAHLGAVPGPQIEVKDGWNTLGREWRVILDVGAGAIDSRGVYKNPGA